MSRFLIDSQGNLVEKEEYEIHDAVMDGSHTFSEGGTIHVRIPGSDGGTGDVVRLGSNDAVNAIRAGGHYVAPYGAERREFTDFGSSAAAALFGAIDYLAPIGTGAMATGGLSKAGEFLGLMEEGDVEKYQKYNPYLWHGAGIGSSIAAAILTGGASGYNQAAKVAQKGFLSKEGLKNAHKYVFLANALGKKSNAVGLRRAIEFTGPAMATRLGMLSEELVSKNMPPESILRFLRRNNKGGGTGWMDDTFSKLASLSSSQAIAGAAEGGLWGAGEGISELVVAPEGLTLGDAAEVMVNSIGMNLFVGALAGTVFGAGLPIVGKLGVGILKATGGTYAWYSETPVAKALTKAKVEVQAKRAGWNEAQKKEALVMQDVGAEGIKNREKMTSIAGTLTETTNDLSDLLDRLTIIDDMLQQADKGAVFSEEVVQRMLKFTADGPKPGTPEYIEWKNKKTEDLANDRLADFTGDPVLVTEDFINNVLPVLKSNLESIKRGPMKEGTGRIPEDVEVFVKQVEDLIDRAQVEMSIDMADRMYADQVTRVAREGMRHDDLKKQYDRLMDDVTASDSSVIELEMKLSSLEDQKPIRWYDLTLPQLIKDVGLPETRARVWNNKVNELKLAKTLHEYDMDSTARSGPGRGLYHEIPKIGSTTQKRIADYIALRKAHSADYVSTERRKLDQAIYDRGVIIREITNLKQTASDEGYLAHKFPEVDYHKMSETLKSVHESFKKVSKFDGEAAHMLDDGLTPRPGFRTTRIKEGRGVAPRAEFAPDLARETAKGRKLEHQELKNQLEDLKIDIKIAHNKKTLAEVEASYLDTEEARDAVEEAAFELRDLEVKEASLIEAVAKADKVAKQAAAMAVLDPEDPIIQRTKRDPNVLAKFSVGYEEGAGEAAADRVHELMQKALSDAEFADPSSFEVAEAKQYIYDNYGELLDTYSRWYREYILGNEPDILTKKEKRKLVDLGEYGGEVALDVEQKTDWSAATEARKLSEKFLGDYRMVQMQEPVWKGRPSSNEDQISHALAVALGRYADEKEFTSAFGPSVHPTRIRTRYPAELRQWISKVESVADVFEPAKEAKISALKELEAHHTEMWKSVYGADPSPGKLTQLFGANKVGLAGGESHQDFKSMSHMYSDLQRIANAFHYSTADNRISGMPMYRQLWDDSRDSIIRFLQDKPHVGPLPGSVNPNNWGKVSDMFGAWRTINRAYASYKEQMIADFATNMGLDIVMDRAKVNNWLVNLNQHNIEKGSEHIRGYLQNAEAALKFMDDNLDAEKFNIKMTDDLEDALRVKGIKTKFPDGAQTAIFSQLKDYVSVVKNKITTNLGYVQKEMPKINNWVALGARNVNIESMISSRAIFSSLYNPFMGLAVSALEGILDPRVAVARLAALEAIASEGTKQIDIMMDDLILHLGGKGKIPTFKQVPKKKIIDPVTTTGQPIMEDVEEFTKVRLKERRRRSRPGIMRAFTAPLAFEPTQESLREEMRKDARKNITDEQLAETRDFLNTVNASDTVLEKFASLAVEDMAPYAPETTNGIKDGIKARMTVAHKAIPQAAETELFSDWTSGVSSVAKATFARVLEAIERPAQAVIFAMVDGTLTPEVVAAVDQFAPFIMNRIRSRYQEAMINGEIDGLDREDQLQYAVLHKIPLANPAYLGRLRGLYPAPGEEAEGGGGAPSQAGKNMSGMSTRLGIGTTAATRTGAV